MKQPNPRPEAGIQPTRLCRIWNQEKAQGTKKLLFSGDILECLSAMSMPLADLIFLAFALSVDAFVVAFSYGLLIKQSV